MLTATESVFPWDVIGGGGAAVAVLAAVWIGWAAMKDIAHKFAETTQDANQKNKDNVAQFTETTRLLVQEAREQHEKCEERLERLHSVVEDHLKDKRR